MISIGTGSQKSTKALKIYYTNIYFDKYGGLDKIPVASEFEMPATKGISKSKLAEISVIYWNYLLNWIDFQLEIGDHVRFIGGIRTTKTKYLILLYFLGSGLD